MNITDKYTVKPIDSFQCREWVVYKHYAKRIPPIEHAFGLFDLSQKLVGIVTYGTPVSNPIRKACAPFVLLELNRLVVNEGLEKNALSYFVAASLALLFGPVIIVSYADIKQGHIGYIYQATNWVYTGLSAKRTDWTIKGMEHLHGATVADMSRGQENRANFMREKFGADFYLSERSRKHRYFYFIGNKREVKAMRKVMPYKIELYPKGDNKRYDCSYSPTIQGQLF